MHAWEIVLGEATGGWKMATSLYKFELGSSNTVRNTASNRKKYTQIS